MSKRLPRTSRRTLDDLRNAAQEARNAPPPPSTPDTTSARDETVEEIVTAPAADREAATATNFPSEASPSARRDGVILHPARPTKAAFRRATARLIVQRHANAAAVAGLVPMPWVDLAAITVIVDRMLRKLARLHGERLGRDRSRQLATAMLTGMAAPGISSFATTGLLRMTPGPHLLGMAITSASAAILVRVVGEAYLDHLGSFDAGRDNDPLQPEMS